MRPWREILGGDWPVNASAELAALVKTRHRDAIKLHHADAGGTHAIAAELNDARDRAVAELEAAAGAGRRKAVQDARVDASLAATIERAWRTFGRGRPPTVEAQIKIAEIRRGGGR